jgi:hypothetical protein
MSTVEGQMTGWTEEDISVLKTMVAQGYSGAEIGKVLGKTRNSVVGKTSRLKLRLEFPAKRRAASKPKAEQKPKRPRNKLESAPHIPFKKSRKFKMFLDREKPNYMFPEMDMTTYDVQNRMKGGVTILDLKTWSCRAILGPVNGINTIYCGEACVIGKSFCPHHCLKYYRIAGSEEDV